MMQTKLGILSMNLFVSYVNYWNTVLSGNKQWYSGRHCLGVFKVPFLLKNKTLSQQFLESAVFRRWPACPVTRQ